MMPGSANGSLVVQTAVRGYHVYQVVWIPTIGEHFVSLHESGNSSDTHAMGVYCDSSPGLLVGHLPKEISRYCYYFTLHDGKISGEVTGPRQHSGISSGGMEIPCLLTLSGRASHIRRIKQFIETLSSPFVIVVSSSTP